MDYAAFKVPSYEHLMGSEQRAHQGSQSHLGSSGTPSSHNSIGGAGTVGGGSTGDWENDPPDSDETVGPKNQKGKSLPEKSGVGNLDYSDE